jgi:hypothetical protein
LQKSIIQTGVHGLRFNNNVRQHSPQQSMKPNKPIFIILILGISILLLSAVFVWKPWKPSGELSKQELIALTNAVRVISTKPIVRIRFSDTDESAYVINDSITDSVCHVE